MLALLFYTEPNKTSIMPSMCNMLEIHNQCDVLHTSMCIPAMLAIPFTQVLIQQCDYLCFCVHTFYTEQHGIITVPHSCLEKVV